MTTLLVAISGGHLMQLRMLSARISSGDDVVWLTNDTAQSRSLLAGQLVYHVPTRPPRDYAGVLQDTSIAGRAISEHRVDRIISTGSQIALSALLPASARRIPFTYIESATRVTGLSTTGRVMERVPWIERYVQYPDAASRKWRYAISVFDGFQVEPSDDPRAIERAVVTVGGNGDFGFRRLVNGAMRVLPDGIDTLWQVGSTDVSDLAIAAVVSMPATELDARMRAADVIIGHAGTGTALAALIAGKVPILSPRSAARGEHIDGHQQDLAAFLVERRLAVVRDADDITPDDLATARGWRATITPDLAPVAL